MDSVVDELRLYAEEILEFKADNERRWNSEFGLPLVPLAELLHKYDVCQEHELSSVLPYFYFLKTNATYDQIISRFPKLNLNNDSVSALLRENREWLSSSLNEVLFNFLNFIYCLFIPLFRSIGKTDCVLHLSRIPITVARCSMSPAALTVCLCFYLDTNMVRLSIANSTPRSTKDIARST
jgi:hypothetical protein